MSGHSLCSMTQSDRMLQRRIDATLMLVLCALAFLWAALRVEPGSGKAAFYQKYFAPAVMRAQGLGFIRPASDAAVPGLEDFLALKRSDVPAVTPGTQVQTRPLMGFQAAHRYLMEATAMCWRIMGISWDALWPLYGILFATMAAGTYLLCRAVLSPALAAAATATFCVSAPVSSQLPHLRDFAKAPFLLLALALVVQASTRPRSRRTLLVMSAAAGATIGIGIGFRMDLLAMLPLSAVLILGFTRANGGPRLATCLGSVAVLIVTAALVSAPVLLAFSRGSNSWHVVILGLMSSFNDTLGISAADTHEIGWRYHDMYVCELINDYAHRQGQPEGGRLEFESPLYEAWGASYYAEVMRIFPADLMLRAIAATIKGFSLWPRPSAVLVGMSLTSVVAVFLLAARLRWGVMYLALLAFFGALVSLQFHERHTFYLSLAPVIGAGFVLQLVADQFARQRQGWRTSPFVLLVACSRTPFRMFRRGSIGRLSVLAGALLLVPASLTAARAYQGFAVEELHAQLDRAPMLSCQFTTATSPGGTTTLTPTRSSDATTPPAIGARMWLLEFTASPSSSADDQEYPQAVRMVQNCSSPGSRFDHSREMVLPLPLSPPGEPRARYVFFTLNSGCPSPSVELDSDAAALVSRFCELDASESGPVLVNALLTAQTSGRIHYQTLGKRPTTEIEGRTEYASFPTAFRPSRRLREQLKGRAGPIDVAKCRIVDRMAEVSADAIAFDGVPKTPYHYLVGLDRMQADGDDVLVVTGTLHEGGIGVGLLAQDKWQGQCTRSAPGHFEFFIRPQPGEYTPMLYHLTPTGRSRFEIHSYGWARAR